MLSNRFLLKLPYNFHIRINSLNIHLHIIFLTIILPRTQLLGLSANLSKLRVLICLALHSLGDDSSRRIFDYLPAPNYP